MSSDPMNSITEKGNSNAITRRDFFRSVLVAIPFVFSPKLSLASEEKSVHEVLAKLTLAMGGAANLQRIGTISMKGNLTMTPDNVTTGVKPDGTFEIIQEWNGYRNRNNIALDAGGVKMKFMQGFNGMESWSYGMNGQLTVKKDADSTAEEKVSARFSSFDYLTHPGQYRFELAEKPRVFVLTVIDRSAEKFDYGKNIIEIDKKNYYPTKITTFEDGARQVVTNESFLTFDGVLFPKRFIQTDGNRMVFDMLSIANVSGDQAAFDPPALPKDFEFLSGTEGHATIKIAYEHILTTVLIHGTPYSFVVDTGAQESVLDLSLAKKLGLRTNGSMGEEGTSGLQPGTMVTAPEMRVGDVVLRNRNIMATDLSFLATKLPRIDGILGSDFFHLFVVRLDYVGGTMGMFDPTIFKYSGAGETFPVHDNSFTLTVDEISGKFGIDTGAGSIDLFSSYFGKTKVFKHKLDLPSVAYRAGLGNSDERECATRIHSLTAGKYTLTDVPVGLSEATTGAFANTDAAGNIGYPFWRRFTTYFNYPAGELILEPNAEYGKPFISINRAGLGVAKHGLQWTVDGVVTHSPAAAEGLKKGDIIMSINGKPLAAMPIEDVPGIFMQPAGTVLNIHYQRGGETKTARLTLRDYIKYYDAY